ncbi:hypothetical protein STCU_10869 [Strigomonas culicis]|uniref:Uncharacterized protein n=1 Tax=Strigomonas culicis TaxID=28005 RepID=S9TKY5_9TRYP|nr:hypothetical protein STCU_10869 [Strigomonas culicis]|eukprot:EPY16988.1 hypothetical protein STCU_10869 [Strigomonas culicis]
MHHLEQKSTREVRKKNCCFLSSTLSSSFYFPSWRSKEFVCRFFFPYLLVLFFSFVFVFILVIKIRSYTKKNIYSNANAELSPKH